MATNVDKSLYAAPAGLAALDEPAQDVEIEIVPDDVEEGLQPDGSMVVDMSGSTRKKSPEETEFGANLAETMDEDTLAVLAAELEAKIDDDKRARADWERTYKEGLALLGLKMETRTEPWEGACGIVHPMITEAVVRFQAETTTETFPAAGPVRSKMIGLETTKKKEAAARVEADMNYLLTEEMSEFRPEHERMLWELPCVGSAFKKVYYDKAKARPVSMFISAEDIILPYGVTNLFLSPRVTHVMRKSKDDLQRLMDRGFYRDVDLGDNQHETTDIQDAKDREAGLSSINDDRFVIYESHADLVVPGDDKHKGKAACPYVITFVKGSRVQVLGLRRNWVEGDTEYCKRQHFVQYDYVPGFGAYGYGLFHLIGGYAKGATAILRQLVDAGTLSNLPGGLKTRGLRVKGDEHPIRPGEWRDVDVGSGTIQQNILPLPYKEPSTVLATLLEQIVADGRKFAATADMQISDMSAQAPVGTTLALLERQLKVLTAVQARVHYSLKNELKLLKEIVKDYCPDHYAYDPATGSKSAKKADYALVDLIPVSDPNASTLSQRVVQHQAAIQMAEMAPEIYDLPVLHREMLDVLGFKNAAKIVPLPEDMKPRDPITENMEILKGKPVKAFLYQDHMAHISCHQNAMQDPMVMQVLGQNPKAPQILAAATAHLAEHMGYLHRQQVEAQLGIQLPPEGQTLPPQVEAALSTMMAEATQRVLEQNQAMAAVAAQQQLAQDPMVALQMEELKVKKQQADTAEKKVVGDLAAKADELRIREMEVSGKLQAEGIKIAVDAEQANATLAANAQQTGMKIGADVAKARAGIEQQAMDRDMQDRHKQDDRQFEDKHRGEDRVANQRQADEDRNFEAEQRTHDRLAAERGASMDREDKEKDRQFQAQTGAAERAFNERQGDKERQFKGEQEGAKLSAQDKQARMKLKDGKEARQSSENLERERLSHDEKKTRMTLAAKKAEAAKKPAAKKPAAKKTTKK